MKILFWVLVVLMVPLYLFLSFFFELSQAVAGFGGVCGEIADFVAAAGSYTAVVGVIGVALGIFFFLKKKKTKTAFLCVLAGLIYGFLAMGIVLALELVHAEHLEARLDAGQQELYGENWDAPSGMEDIPECYGEILNKVYVIADEAWSVDRIRETDLYLYRMPEFYGESGTDSIGFAFIDLSGDGVDEMLIGTAGDGEYTTVFSVYTDPTDPFPVLTCAEGELYYLHESDGRYQAEIGGVKDDGTPATGSWTMTTGDAPGDFDTDYSDAQLDASGRMKLEMIPFSQYR